MRPDDLLRFVWIADPQISPDGRRAVFTHVSIDREADDYRTALWIADLDAGASAPRPLTAGGRDSQPRWSPDGSRLAFVRAVEEGKPGQLYVLPMNGGEAERVTDLEKGASAPAWSPDGKRLAFSSATNVALDRPEAKKPKREPVRIVTKPEYRWNDAGFVDFEHRDHVWILDVDPARERLRTAASKSETIEEKPAATVHAATGGRALDGARVAEPEAAPGAARGTTTEKTATRESSNGGATEPGRPRQLTIGNFVEGPPQWSRDGRRILFTSDRRAEPWFGTESADLYAIDPDLAEPSDGAAFERLTDVVGPIAAFTEGPNGSFAVVSSIPGDPLRSYDQSKLVRFDSPWPAKTRRVLTEKWDFDFGSDDIAGDQHPPRGGGAKPLAWSADEKSIYGVALRHGAAMLARVDAESGAVSELTDAKREVVCGSATRDAKRFALTVGDVTRPGDLCVFDVAEGKLRTVWSPNEELLREAKLGEVEEFWCDAKDGKKIHGWIVKPLDFDASKKYPAILQIHGGPHTAYGVGFFHEFRQLAAAGYVVIYTNPRGSTTYGQEFGNVIQFHYPGDDHDDLMTAVDHVIARGYVDPKKLGITGGSGGGLLTNWAIAKTDRFAAAISQRCVSDWISMWYACDFSMFTPAWFKVPPYEDPQHYMSKSPFFMADQINTPLLVVHSEEDWRTPTGQGEAMFRALKRQKKPVAMIRFPGESHELTRSGMPSHRVQNQEHARKWFDHWLMGKKTEEYGL